jgi:EAL domain-containing protein (putative c-di-GMP-specific phosphodiesterase class I)
VTAEFRRWCETRRKDSRARFSAETSSALGRVLRLVREHLGMDIAWLSRADDGDQVLELLDGATDRSRVYDGLRSPALTELCGSVLAGRKPAVAGDAGRVDPTIVAELGLGSYVLVALPRTGEGSFGVLCCASAEPNDSLRPRDADTVRLFAETLAETIGSYEERHRIEQQFLGQAEAMIAAGGPKIALQPIIELATRRTIAVEALSRFPTDAYDTEGWFAEASRAGGGLELELDAVSAALDLLPSIPAGQRLSVNASPALVISPGLAAVLDGHPYERLIIEVTEHHLAESIDALIERAKQLQDKGAWVAIDDTGTGYSSMHQILQVAPDVIKLDRALVSNVDADPMKRALAHAFVTFTREAGVRLIAEGVETAAELRTLEELGVPLAQGFYLARPALPAQVSPVSAEVRTARPQEP